MYSLVKHMTVICKAALSDYFVTILWLLYLSYQELAQVKGNLSLINLYSVSLA